MSYLDGKWITDDDWVYDPESDTWRPKIRNAPDDDYKQAFENLFDDDTPLVCGADEVEVCEACD